MTKIKSCLLCENYKTHHSECEHCEDWDNFRISESGKALREKIYGDGYQDGHRDGYDKGYDDAQANNNKPQGEWVAVDSYSAFGGSEETWMAHGNPTAYYYCSNCKQDAYANDLGEDILSKFCPFCGAIMRNPNKEK